MTERTTRAQRMTAPLGTGAVKMLAEASGGCIRPVQLRRTDLDTGQVEQVWSPAARPWPANAPPAPNEPRSCERRSAGKAGTSRTNPSTSPTRPTTGRPGSWRTEAQQLHEHAAGQDTGDLDELITELDAELARAGIRGNPDPGKKGGTRRHRSTRRRQDAPDLPRRKISPRTTGNVYRPRRES